MGIKSLSLVAGFFIFFCSFAAAQDQTSAESKNLSKTDVVQESGTLEKNKAEEGGDQVQKPSLGQEALEFRDPFRSALPRERVNDSPSENDFFAGESGNQAELSENDNFDVSQFTVTGLVWGEAAPKAIINDEIYGIGDILSDAKILKINKEGILLDYHNKKYLLKREGAAGVAQGGGL